MPRNGFIFYSSFYESISELDSDTRLQIYDAVMLYALHGKKSDLSGVPAALFKLIQPQLDANNARYENGCKGGRPKTMAKPKQNLNKTKPEPKEKEKEKEKENDKEKEIYIPIISYLNEWAGTKFKATSKKTQQLIDARMNEGYTLDDFKTVIQKKCAKWKDDPKMCEYLRPETLFGNKFEGYLNEKIVSRHGYQQRGDTLSERDMKDREECDKLLDGYYETEDKK